MAYKVCSDKTLFLITSLLTIFGLLMVYSASSVVASSQHDGMSSYYFLRQLAFGAVGYFLLLVLMNTDYHFWQKKKVLISLVALCLAALALVLIQPKINGAHRWLRYGSLISFQPSEISKLALLAFLAAFLHKNEEVINDPRHGLLPCLAAIGIFAGLVVIEPDLGQAVCMSLIAAIMLFLAGLSWRYLAAAGALMLPAFYFFVIRVPFRYERVVSFLNPFHDPRGTGWQIAQSLTAVGSGGVTGVGLGASTQKLFFLPEAQSDFIFAVIGEELGLAGTCLVAIAFLVFFYRGIKITLKAPDRFGFYMGIGITLMVVVQAFINISMVLAMMPTKGIALPFISSGGSSLFMNLVATGVLLNISQHGERA